MKNLVLLQFKLAWDIFLMIAVIFLQFGWLAFLFGMCGIPIMIFILLACVFVTSLDMVLVVLWPLLLLLCY